MKTEARFLLAVVLMLGVLVGTNWLFPPVPVDESVFPADSAGGLPAGVEADREAPPPAFPPAGPEVAETTEPETPDAVDPGTRPEAPPEIEIPVEVATTTLRFPSTLDRNKAGAMLSGLAKKPKNHAVILREAGEILFAMLQLTQPNNHDFAYEILKTISGRNHGARDYRAWHDWLQQARAVR